MRIRLTGGAYTARSLLASAQRQVNLYSEKNPDGAIVDFGAPPAPIATLYPTPGLRLLGTPPAPDVARGLYWATSGTLFCVVGATLYHVTPGWTMTAIGTIGPDRTPVSMVDNGLTLVLVDGTTNGYQVDLASLAFRAINGAQPPGGNAPTTNTANPAASAVYGFYGADRAAVIDGYLLFNQPGTRNFYSTYNGEVTFDSLYVAAKNGYSDKLVAVAVNQRAIWLIGERTTEIWFDAGNADFPFAIMPGPFVHHGCVAKYSVAQISEAIYWLSQDQAGRNVCVRTQGYNVNRISTHAIEAEWATYPDTTDAVAHTFQFGGHPMYQITFPAADRTWRFDEATGEWHEAVWLDANGTEHRHRAGAIAHAYGQIVAADWQTGALYTLDPDVYTDVGAPIMRLRGFPHIVADGKRVFYRQFLCDLEAGTG